MLYRNVFAALIILYLNTIWKGVAYEAIIVPTYYCLIERVTYEVNFLSIVSA